MAINAQGAQFFISATGATAVDTATAAALIGGVRGFNGPSGAAAVIDITELQTTSGKLKMMGLKDEGQFSMDAFIAATDVGQIRCRNHRNDRSIGRVTVKFNDASTSIMQFKAYVMSYTISGSVDGVLTGSIGCEISGAVTFSTA